MENIKNQPLVKDCSYINGEWVCSEQTFDVLNPATELVVATVTEVESYQVEAAIIAADNALKVWQTLTPFDRSHRLDRWQKLLRESIDQLAQILVSEQGKPLHEARAEINHAADYVEHFAKISRSLVETTSIASDANLSAEVIKRPIGVVSAITPWNFPCSMVLRKAAAAMAAGCCIVLKPSDLTPLTALATAQLSKDADIPAGVFNVVVGSNAQAIGELLTQHDKVRKFSFTGSTKVGKKLLQQCAAGVKRTAMELGGNAPFIVFKDADIDAAAEGAIQNKFRNAGQTCVTANRFIVHSEIIQEFQDILVEKMAAIKVGNGNDPETNIGPLISQHAMDKIDSLIVDAKNKGAKVIVGGGKINRTGSFFEPTLVVNVTPEMALFGQEIFGPVIALTSFDTKQQALSLANQTEYGLSAYVFSSDQKTIDTIAPQLEVGMLGINQASLSNPYAPFGGVKHSGMGREGGHYGVEEYLDLQYVCKG